MYYRNEHYMSISHMVLIVVMEQFEKCNEYEYEIRVYGCATASYERL